MLKTLLLNGKLEALTLGQGHGGVVGKKSPEMLKLKKSASTHCNGCMFLFPCSPRDNLGMFIAIADSLFSAFASRGRPTRGPHQPQVKPKSFIT